MYLQPLRTCVREVVQHSRCVGVTRDVRAIPMVEWELLQGDSGTVGKHCRFSLVAHRGISPFQGVEQQPENPRGCSRHVGLTPFVAAGRELNQVGQSSPSQRRASHTLWRGLGHESSTYESGLPSLEETPAC